MRDTNYLQALSSARELSARVTLTDILMRFSVTASYADNIDIASMDSDMVGTALLRVAIKEGTNQIYFVYNTSSASNFTSTTWSDTLLTAFAGSRVGLYQSRMFYQGADGVIYYVDYSSGWGTPVSTGISYAEPVSIAPVSSTEFYAVLLDTNGSDPYQMRRVFYHTTSGATVEYHGRIYGEVSSVNIVDAARLDGVDYIYLLDNTDKRTIYIKRTGDIWSEVKQVVPMDVVDDITSFVMSSVNVINDYVVVTGVLSRSYGDPMHVYMLGPEEFTAGREYFIRSESIDKEGGKLHFFDGKAWYIGEDFRFQAEQTAYLGATNSALTTENTDVHEFQLMGSQNSGYSGSATLFHDFEHAALRAGSRAKLEVKVNDEYSNLGTFNLEALSRPVENPGTALELALKSESFKRLSQWASDTPYDYWSQTKSSILAKELTELVRVSGHYEESGDYLYPTGFNEDSFMYTTARASRNGIMRARFKRVSPSVFLGNNRGFELGDFTDWIQERTMGVDSEFTIHTYDGNSYAIFTAGSYDVEHSDPIGGKLASSKEAVEDGEQYQFEFLSIYPSSGSACYPSADVYWYDEDDVAIGTSAFTFNSAGSPVAFERLTLVATAPSGARSCNIVVDYWCYGFAWGSNLFAVDEFAMTPYPAPSGEHAKFGVGINYYLESRYDASLRLGVNQEDVEDEDCGGNGIFAIYESNDTEEGIGLYQLIDGVWGDRLAFYSLALTRDTGYWLQIGFNEGLVEVHYRLDAIGSAWTKVISHVFSSYTSLPWKSDSLGRGAIYCRNITPHSASFSFSNTVRRIPVLDSSVFSDSDLVLVDDELILFTNKKDMTAVEGLSWVPGKLLASYTPDASIDYARYSPMGVNSYQSGIAQVLSLDSRKHFVTAIDVRAAKCSNDALASSCGLSCGIFTGTADGIGTRVGELATVPADDIPFVDNYNDITDKVDMGTNLYAIPPVQDKVRFKFSKPIIVRDGDKFAISTEPNIYKDYDYDPVVDGELEDLVWVYAKNRANVSPNNTVNGYAGRTRWYDWTNMAWDASAFWTNAQYAWGIEFDVYENAYKNSPSVIHVAHSASLSATNDFYKGYNIVVTSGLGEGQSFRILGYKYNTAGCAFLVDQEPVLDKTSVLAVVPALTQAIRGMNGTLALAHGGSTCHVYRALPFVMFDKALYLSSDQDYCLEDMVRNIARKAGVLSVTGANEYPDTINPTDDNSELDKHNFVIKLTLPALTGTVIVSGRRDTYGQNIVFSSSSITYERSGTTIEVFPLDAPLIGEVVVSYWEDYASVWCNGKFITGFDIHYAYSTSLFGDGLKITGTHNGNIGVYIPEASIRIDNFILDEGKKGDALVGEVIGEKRFRLQDEINGGLKIFRDRVTVNTELAPYTLSVSGDHAHSDVSVVTRMRLEGTDIKEQFDTEMMAEYGNIYRLLNMYEINSPADAEFYSDFLLEEAGSMVVSKEYIGAADPRVEPDDVIWAQTSAGTHRIIVSSVLFAYAVSQEAAMFDMTLTGFVPREDVL